MGEEPSRRSGLARGLTTAERALLPVSLRCGGVAAPSAGCATAPSASPVDAPDMPAPEAGARGMAWPSRVAAACTPVSVVIPCGPRMRVLSLGGCKLVANGAGAMRPR